MTPYVTYINFTKGQQIDDCCEVEGLRNDEFFTQKNWSKDDLIVYIDSNGDYIPVTTPPNIRVFSEFGWDKVGLGIYNLKTREFKMLVEPDSEAISQ